MALLIFCACGGGGKDSPADEVDEPFTVSFNLDFGDNAFLILEDGEYLPLIVENRTDIDYTIDASLLVNCPQVDYSGSILETQSSVEAGASVSVEFELQRELLLVEGNSSKCQVTPQVSTHNTNGDEVQSEGKSIWIDPSQSPMKIFRGVE